MRREFSKEFNKDKIKHDLARSIMYKDQVKVYWIPKDFKNRMEDVEQLLKDETISRYQH
ncbi:hypothetical protein Lgra_0206 [Legionella gratiana]|uniref:Uncharacterized protein n=1 Tax=Legionella gratiana TaxID=45066 RepID=A0A378JCQ4_9GAMM|nr:hypothetical protein [Legionella gratiana]KTD15540.1 hypothetical protein Lgra_0206 [Legionella gratiana]STX45116.1 Uncharacterised protein [Legionella gratiana]